MRQPWVNKVFFFFFFFFLVKLLALGVLSFSSSDKGLKLSNLLSLFALLRWAVSTVITRQNKIPSTTGEPTLALIPMWDICNHSNGTVGVQCIHSCEHQSLFVCLIKW